MRSAAGTGRGRCIQPVAERTELEKPGGGMLLAGWRLDSRPHAEQAPQMACRPHLGRRPLVRWPHAGRQAGLPHSCRRCQVALPHHSCTLARPDPRQTQAPGMPAVNKHLARSDRPWQQDKMRAPSAQGRQHGLRMQTGRACSSVPCTARETRFFSGRRCSGAAPMYSTQVPGPERHAGSAAAGP